MIVIYDKDDLPFYVCEDTAHASRKLGVNRSTISRALKHKTVVKWRYTLERVDDD